MQRDTNVIYNSEIIIMPIHMVDQTDIGHLSASFWRAEIPLMLLSIGPQGARPTGS